MSVKPLKTPPSTGGDYELAPPDVYVARCFQMIDLGTQTIKSQQYGTKQVRQVMLNWELLLDDEGEAVRREDKSVFTLSNTYTWSMSSKANLRKAVDSWRGTPFTDKEATGFDLTKLLGTYCKIQVVHNQSGDRTYANVGSIMATKKRPEAINEVGAYSMDDPDEDYLATLPQWIQDKILSSEENSLNAEDQEQHEQEVEDTEIDVKDVQF